MDEYYAIRGWTPDGLPTAGTLSSLELPQEKEVLFA
jgi:aldehyde:ferredoxin oxidoreductase